MTLHWSRLREKEDAWMLVIFKASDRPRSNFLCNRGIADYISQLVFGSLRNRIFNATRAYNTLSITGYTNICYPIPIHTYTRTTFTLRSSRPGDVSATGRKIGLAAQSGLYAAHYTYARRGMRSSAGRTPSYSGAHVHPALPHIPLGIGTYKTENGSQKCFA